ncbi:MAG: Ig-like domain-containing domain, partial [Planctomycetota bacterium]
TLVETIPKDGEIDVAAAADVVLRFTEPMKPDSFKLGQSVFVRNLSIDRAVLGSLRFSTDAKTVTFRPVFGYGTGPSEIFVRVTTAVTNLPGNPIPKEIRVQFVSIFDATQFNQGDVQEAFTDNVYEDTTFQTVLPLADWNKGVTQGFLAGTFTAGTVTVSASSNTYAWPPWAWGANFAGQTQIMFLSGEIGGARTITGFEWFKYCRQSQTVSNVTINMGHTNAGTMTTNMATNYSDTPVVCVNNQSSYTISQVPLTGWTFSPTYTTNFLYNGNDNMILEILCTSGANGGNNGIWAGYWRVTPTGSIQRNAYTTPAYTGSPNPTTSVYTFHTRFAFLIDGSEAQSKWYDMGIRAPLFLDVFLEPDLATQPAGTSSTFTFQGAPEDLSDPGNPDMLNATQWVDDLEKLTGLKFVRFHVTFKSNQSTNTRPMFDTVIFPFVWK